MVLLHQICTELIRNTACCIRTVSQDAELGKFGITVEQRAGYAKAKAYAKKCREKEKGEGKHGHIGRGGGGAGAEKSKGGQV